MPRDLPYYKTRMLAEQVAPHLRSKCSEWEDEWYPKMVPMDDSAVPQTPNGVAGITLPAALRAKVGAAFGS